MYWGSWLEHINKVEFQSFPKLVFFFQFKIFKFFSDTNGSEQQQQQTKIDLFYMSTCFRCIEIKRKFNGKYKLLYFS